MISLKEWRTWWLWSWVAVFLIAVLWHPSKDFGMFFGQVWSSGVIAAVLSIILLFGRDVLKALFRP